MSSKASSFLQWATGIFYFNSDARFTPSQTNFGPPVVSAASPLDEVLDFGDERTNSIAAYGQATAALSPSTHLTLGIRYTYEARILRGDEFGFVGAQIPIGPLFPAVNEGVHYSKPTWRIALDHRFSPQVLGYVSYNRGFKSGGFNVSDPTNPAYRPETLDAYEIGVKTDLLNKRLRVDVSGFYYTYSQIQVARFTTGAIDFYNGAEADIYGLDLDLDAVITRSLRLTGGFDLLHDRFSSFPNAEIGTPLAAGGTAETLGSAAGNRLPFSPDAVINLAADFTHDYGPLHLSANVAYAYNTRLVYRARQRAPSEPVQFVEHLHGAVAARSTRHLPEGVSQEPDQRRRPDAGQHGRLLRHGQLRAAENLRLHCAQNVLTELRVQSRHTKAFGERPGAIKPRNAFSRSRRLVCRLRTKLRRSAGRPAAVGAEADLVPVAGPFAAPGEGAAAGGAGLLRQVGLGHGAAVALHRLTPPARRRRRRG